MVNKVILVGNVGKDPEVRHLESGAVLATLTIATTESYKNQSGEKVSQTEWHNLVFWNNLAGIVEKYVKKGDKIYVEGKIKTRSYEAQDGSKKYITEIFVSTLQMLGSPSRQNSGNAPSNHPEPEESYTDEVAGDLPF